MEMLKRETCPNCGNHMEDCPGFVTWCEECDYNLNPGEKEEPRTKIEKIYLKLGERTGRAMFDRMMSEKEVEKGVFGERLGALALATIIHAISIMFLFISIYFILHWNDGFWAKIFGPFFILCSWATRPRLYKIDKKEQLLTRKELPNTFKFLDEMTQNFNIKPLHGIVVDGNYNAGVTSVGLTGRTIMYIGLPLFAVLTKEERLSLFAHELGHIVNKDIKRSTYIGTALQTAGAWFYLLNAPEEDAEDAFSVIAHFILKLLSYIPYGICYVLIHLHWQSKQRAEYLADLFEAKVSGTETAVSAIKKLHYSDMFYYTVQNVALQKKKDGLIDQFLSNVNSLPEKEVRRLLRKSELEQSRLDLTHPPHTFRMKFLEKNNRKGTMSLSDEKNKLIEQELEGFKNKIEGKLVDQYLYYLS